MSLGTNKFGFSRAIVWIVCNPPAYNEITHIICCDYWGREYNESDLSVFWTKIEEFSIVYDWLASWSISSQWSYSQLHSQERPKSAIS